jgi:quercetin 2,3-dioxygenase
VGRVTDVRRAGDRYPGGEPENGVTTAHAFSFGPHYDPDNLRFGPLVACNEERLAPGAGFAEHPHSHTEIVTWVAEGELTHRDSAGHATTVRAGDLQRLSAGAGVRHTERNDGETPLVFVQMWLAPLEPGGPPSYETVRADPAAGAPFTYVLPTAEAVLRVHRLNPGDRAPVPDAGAAYLHVVRGTAALGGALLGPGDSARLTAPRGLEFTAPAEKTDTGESGGTVTEVLVWEFTG